MSHTELYRADTTASRILDASAAGRSMLTAADAAAQRTLLSVPDVAKVYEKVALSPNGAAIAAGAGKGFVPVSHAGTITAFSVQCDPNNEPTVTIEVDLNKVNTSDGTVTSVLSSVASITSGNNSGTGTINGTQTVSVGDWLQVDIDQGSDGQDLIGIIEITPS